MALPLPSYSLMRLTPVTRPLNFKIRQHLGMKLEIELWRPHFNLKFQVWNKVCCYYIQHQIETQDLQNYWHWEMIHTGNSVLLDTLKLALQASLLCFVSLSIISSLFLRTIIVFPVYFITWTLLLYILHKTSHIPISLKFTQSRSSDSIWNLN